MLDLNPQLQEDRIAPMELFMGPCVLESREMALDIAYQLNDLLTPWLEEGSINWTFKASFDKANRTSGESFRGLGLEKGLQILEEIKNTLGISVVTDFHLPSQAMDVACVVDVLQVPAFLCRQTDMIIEGAKAAEHFKRKIKIKKGQFLSPYDMKEVVQKCTSFLNLEDILLTERGSCFGYNNLIVDMSSFSIMAQLGTKIIHDATHCVQKPGNLGNKTGGAREHILTISKAALAAGAHGIFAEVHPQPELALSDAATSLPLSWVQEYVECWLSFYQLSQQYINNKI